MKKAFTGLTSVKSLFDNYKSLAIISAFLTISLFATAQVQYDSTRVLQNINADGYSYKNLELRGKLRLWRDTFPMAFKDSGSIAYKNQNIYIWTGRSWKQPGSSFDSSYLKTLFSRDGSVHYEYSVTRDTIFSEINVDSLLTGINSSGISDGILFVQSLQLIDSSVSVVPPIIYARGGVKDTLPSGTSIVIPAIAAGSHQRNIIALNASNAIDTLRGVIDTARALPPALPADWFQICIVDVDGSVITINPPAITTNSWNQQGNAPIPGAVLGSLTAQSVRLQTAGKNVMVFDSAQQVRMELENNASYPHLITVYNKTAGSIPVFNLSTNSSKTELAITANNAGYQSTFGLSIGPNGDSLKGGAYNPIVIKPYDYVKVDPINAPVTAFIVSQANTPLFTVGSGYRPGVRIGNGDSAYDAGNALKVYGDTKITGTLKLPALGSTGNILNVDNDGNVGIVGYPTPPSLDEVLGVGNEGLNKNLILRSNPSSIAGNEVELKYTDTYSSGGALILRGGVPTIQTTYTPESIRTYSGVNINYPVNGTIATGDYQIPLKFRLNGTTYTANDSSIVDLGSAGGDSGVSSFSFTNTTGITGTVSNATTTPALSLAIDTGAISGFTAKVREVQSTSSSLPDTIVMFHTYQSNGINNSVAGDTSFAGKNFASDPNIQVLNSGAYATANYYTNNIAGGSVVRENLAMVIAKQLRTEKSNRVVRILSEGQTNTALSSWTLAQTGFGEKDTVNTMYYRIQAKLASIPVNSPKISVVIWQQGEKDEIDTTLSSYWLKMRSIDSLFRASGKFTSDFTTIFCMPTVYYPKLRAAYDSIENRSIDIGIRDWRIAKASFTGGVDLTHISNWQQYQLGVTAYKTLRNWYPSGKTVQGVNSVDTTTNISASNPTVSAGIKVGLVNNFTRTSVFTGSTLFSFVPVEVSGSPLYSRILSGTSPSLFVASQNATTGQGSFIKFTRGGYATGSASIKGEVYATGGGIVLNYYNTSSAETEGLRISNAGLVGINNNTPASTLTITGSLATAYVAKATSYTATTSDCVIAVTATGQTITLPTAVGITGRNYTIKLTASGTGTVATTSSQTIDGSTTYSLSAQYKYITVQSDGANWNIIANN